ncbi:LysM peptidoglycan-binding domain-containing protein [Actinotalea sp. Marseille-Q4924]|uniref:LysM peptidoglycan-binding domain-containing protein n=1 Tax=Actinotalea sp. Marseille-Q4924 TaxID=2866571 RepID=UPI001CE4937A|nr:LysM peptidoglycan-binding domain-containing protein [Actinotalea sp. Marseille-Q4924]
MSTTTTARIPSTMRPATAGALRLTRRGRAAVVLLAGGLAAGGVLSAQAAAAGGPGGAVPVTAYVVEPGDTVWEIAEAVARPGQDVRDVVARIEDLNGLEGGQIHAGQRVVVPAG